MFIRIHYFTFKKNALENLFVIINVQMSTLVKFFPFKKEFFPLSFCTVNTTLLQYFEIMYEYSSLLQGHSVWRKISKNIDLKAFECGFSKLRGYFQISQCLSETFQKFKFPWPPPQKICYRCCLLCMAMSFKK